MNPFMLWTCRSCYIYEIQLKEKDSKIKTQNSTIDAMDWIIKNLLRDFYLDDQDCKKFGDTIGLDLHWSENISSDQLIILNSNISLIEDFKKKNNIKDHYKYNLFPLIKDLLKTFQYYNNDGITVLKDVVSNKVFTFESYDDYENAIKKAFSEYLHITNEINRFDNRSAEVFRGGFILGSMFLLLYNTLYSGVISWKSSYFILVVTCYGAYFFSLLKQFLF